MSDFVLQGCSKLIDIAGGNVHGKAVLEKGNSVASDRVAPDLQQQSVDGVGIEFLRRESNDFAESVANRERFAIRTLAGHGVKRVRQADDADRHGNVFHHQAIGISRTVATLMVRANDLRDARPRELNTAHDLMSHDRVVRHLAKFFGIKRCNFSEQTLVYRDLANIVQVAGGAQPSNFAGIHAHGLSDGGGVAAHTQGVAVNVHVFDIDRRSEGFQRGVVKTVEGCQQSQILRDALCQCLRQNVILNRNCHVVT